MKKNDLKNKKVMVTGGAGFIGSTLVRELAKEGAKVIVFDIFSSGDMSNLKGIEKDIKVIRGDITSIDSVRLSTAIGLVRYAYQKHLHKVRESANPARRLSTKLVDLFNDYF